MMFRSFSSSSNGHFLNASDNHKSGSVWASLPQPSSLAQTAPPGIKTANGTVYVAFAVSDGDNLSFLQGRMQSLWTQDQFVGVVPTAWTSPPGAINFSPAMMNYFFTFLPQSNEMMAGPSGVGYATGNDRFGSEYIRTYTHDFMAAEGMNTVTSWQTSCSHQSARRMSRHLPPTQTCRMWFGAMPILMPCKAAP
jgi:GxGYxYP putative glycoside hydrolase C-terminal domain